MAALLRSLGLGGLGCFGRLRRGRRLLGRRLLRLDRRQLLARCRLSCLGASLLPLALAALLALGEPLSLAPLSARLDGIRLGVLAGLGVGGLARVGRLGGGRRTRLADPRLAPAGDC